MSFGAAGSAAQTSVPGFKQFVSEEELEDKRRKRQEEWEKVRQPDQPLEAPEEEYDPRSLYERLEEQKQKKQDEYEDQFKLKNQVKGLESDEAEFLDFVSQKQMEMTKQREIEEDVVLSEYRNAVTSRVVEKPSSAKGASVPKKPSPAAGKKSQAALLVGAVKRKGSDASSPTEKKARTSEMSPEEGASDEALPDSTTEGNTDAAVDGSKEEEYTSSAACADTTTTRAGCAGGQDQRSKVVAVLPGMGAYSNSSSSDSNSSDSEDIEMPPLIYKPKYAVIRQGD